MRMFPCSLFALSVLAGCGSRPASSGAGVETTLEPAANGSGPTAKPEEAGILPALYADLFQRGRSFAYLVHGESSHYDPDDPQAVAGGQVISRSEERITCTVTEVRDIPGGRLATLDCGHDGNGSFAVGLDGVTPAGHYAATKDGLFRFSLGSPVPPQLDPAEIIMPREPKPMRRVEKLADGERTEEISTSPDGTGCSARDFMMGDASHQSFCFLAGKGLVSMAGGWDGGSSHSATFTLTR